MSKTTVASIPLTDHMTCADCGCLVQPANAFHPYLYCWLRKQGVNNPGAFLKAHGFIPDPKAWGEV